MTVADDLDRMPVVRNLQDFDRDNDFHSTFSEATVKFGYTFRF